MALLNVNRMQNVNICSFSATHLMPFTGRMIPLQSRSVSWKPLVVEAKMRKRTNSRIESPKIRARRMRRKYNGTPSKPRLSVFLSEKQLYAMLVDDENKKCLFYGSTLQKSLRIHPDMTTAEAAKAVGEELVKAAMKLNITEISSYDRNGSACGERMRAFEIAIFEHGFLPLS
ncbi:hypothetical protein RND81_07G181800 [Saponaria officinalis]|uniref:50S ribosomal protein L18, chloroplastic n=1 Tax=Saponaria officinalis TaxID=3572 RepID=A0AAW1JRL2_SAPOF